MRTGGREWRGARTDWSVTCTTGSLVGRCRNGVASGLLPQSRQWRGGSWRNRAEAAGAAFVRRPSAAPGLRGGGSHRGGGGRSHRGGEQGGGSFLHILPYSSLGMCTGVNFRFAVQISHLFPGLQVAEPRLHLGVGPLHLLQLGHGGREAPPGGGQLLLQVRQAQHRQSRWGTDVKQRCQIQDVFRN